MERSSQHGPALDDAMKRETESVVRGGRDSHVEEWREAEPSGEDEPTVAPVLAGGLEPGTPDGMTRADVEVRAELAKHLRPSAFPANRQMLVQTATEESAPAPVLELLRQLPDGREFVNVQDVWSAIGGGTEEHRS
ncbi:MAG: DUF2795 domain-containing protein [Mycobacteriales bacterium]|nr:DUF2795 domain-containing protein [Frankia sp.]